jgi:hypothetical protein
MLRCIFRCGADVLALLPQALLVSTAELYGEAVEGKRPHARISALATWR